MKRCNINVEQMKSALGMTSVPDVFNEIYIKSKGCYAQRSSYILSHEYITKTLTDCYALLPYMDTILAAANKIRENDAMLLLVYLLEQWVKMGGNIDDSSYTPPIGEGIEYDFIHLFAAIPTIPDSVEYLRKRGLSEEIIADTMKEYDFCLEFYSRITGRIGFDRGRLWWMRMIIQNKLIKVGRLKFELPKIRLSGARVYKNKDGELAVFADKLHVHRNGRIVGSTGCEDEVGSFVANVIETDDEIIGHLIIDCNISRKKTTLAKKEWELCLCEEDLIINVHIPPDGKLDIDSVEASYNGMREIMARCYPEMEYKAFFCESWLMSEDLRNILKPNSNIITFQDKYFRYPCRSGITAPFVWVFPGEGGVDNIENFSETTSLQRAIKSSYKNGCYIYNNMGFFF